MLQNLYHRTMRLADHPHAIWWLALVAFVESSVFMIPPDVLMIPMILARPSKAWLIAGVAVIASVAGGVAGYAIGALAFETVGQPVLQSLGQAEAMAVFNERFNEYGVWAVLIAGVTPFPYKVITIMSGWTGLSLGLFIVSSLVARALRFFVVAALLRAYGPPVRQFIEKRLGLMFTIFMALLLGGFVMIRFM